MERQQVVFSGVDRAELSAVLATGVDHGGNPIEPFVDENGRWSLRCCLRDAEPGDLVAIIAWSPFPWEGPYREIGPVVVHALPCTASGLCGRLPTALDQRAMVLRPYGHDRRIAYDHVRHIGAGGSLTAETAALLEIDEVEFVHGRNVTGGCFSFAATG